MTKERRLGRGLEALLGRMTQRVELPEYDHPGPAAEPGPSAPQPETIPYGRVDSPQYSGIPGVAREDHGPSSTGVIQVDVHLIESNPFQPRQTFDAAEMQSLAESLATHGLLQPIVVRRVDGMYQIVAGERRFRAARQLGWREVPVNVVEADDRQMAEIAIVENMQRKDLNPLEKAASFQQYLQQYGCTQEELASRLKIDRSSISNMIRLLELPPLVQDALREGKITQGHARALLPLGEEREQIEFSERIQREGLSVRQTEAMVQEIIREADGEPLGVVDTDGKRRKPKLPSEHLAVLEQEFRAALGVKVKITHNARGRGKMTIPFRSHEEFERLRQHICGPGKPMSQGQVG